MFLFVLAKLLPKSHNLYGNSLDFKLKIYERKKNRNLLQLHLKTTRGIYGNKKLEQMKERGSTSFKNNQRHLFENKKIEQKKERGSTSGAGDLPGCQLEANCPGPEDCGLSKY